MSLLNVHFLERMKMKEDVWVFQRMKTDEMGVCGRRGEVGLSELNRVEQGRGKIEK